MRSKLPHTLQIMAVVAQTRLVQQLIGLLRTEPVPFQPKEYSQLADPGRQFLDLLQQG